MTDTKRAPAPGWVPGDLDHDQVPITVTWYRGVGDHDFKEETGSEAFGSYMAALASIVETYGERATHHALTAGNQGGWICWLNDDLGFSLEEPA